MEYWFTGINIIMVLILRLSVNSQMIIILIIYTSEDLHLWTFKTPII
jgi:hypothetical protein